MQINPVTRENEQQAVDIISAAFHDDPVINWLSDRPGFMQTFFEFTLPVFTPHGLCFIDGEGRGATAWLGPGGDLKWPFTPSSLSSLFRACGLKGLYRLLRSSVRMEGLHPKEPHYYLFAIGALPQYKGMGVGSALMSDMLRRCDRENMPAYLENSKEQNLAFYQGHGFKVMEKITFAKGAPPIWLMWREPLANNFN